MRITVREGFMSFGNFLATAKGGDLIFIQDERYIDNYTKMNTQQAHIVKMLLRFKREDVPKEPVKCKSSTYLSLVWSAIGIVVDSEQEDVKYILEVDDKGMRMFEMISRILHFKTENRTIAVKQKRLPLEILQSGELTELMHNLQGKNWKQLIHFKDPEDRLLIKDALVDSKKILTDIKEDSFISQQLQQIFSLYLKDANQTHIFPEQAVEFIMYLCISKEEQEDQQMEFITKLEEEGMVEDKMLSFQDMIQLLHDTDSFYDLEMTHTERHSTVAAQILMQVLKSVRVLDEVAEDVRDVNDLEEGLGNFDQHFEDTHILMYVNIDDRGNKIED